MTARTYIAVFALLLLAACEKSQPTIEETNASTTAELSLINSLTSPTDGMDQGNEALMGVPTTGQQMDAQQQPAKRQ